MERWSSAGAVHALDLLSLALQPCPLPPLVFNCVIDSRQPGIVFLLGIQPFSDLKELLPLLA